MKSNNKWITTAAVLALSTSLAVAAPNGGGYGKGHGRGDKGAMSEKLAQKLNLTDAQKQQVKELEASFRDQNKAFFEQSRATMKEARDAREAGDTARLDALRPKIEAQQAQMKQLRDAQTQRILSILTPEQRQQWEALKAERGSKHDKRGLNRQ